jgi:diaminopimelate decarboxylase
LLRITPGIEADTHEKIRTGHLGSKFGVPIADAAEVIGRARDARLEMLGLHVHLGSQVVDDSAALAAVEQLADFCAETAATLGWTPAVVNLGGGLGIRYTLEDDEPPSPESYTSGLVARLRTSWAERGLPPAQLIFEPGRSLVGRAGITLYRVGVVKRSGPTTWVAVDGGMSDNPRPALYGARYAALLANRADESTSGTFAVCGKHCESGDVLIERADLPEPRRGDLLAVPVTGAYTLAMASNYNALPRPAAVLVERGEGQLIRRREGEVGAGP